MNKILLIDDTPSIHEVVTSSLEGDHLVVSAFNLEQADDLLRQETFELIILDVNLPDGDGFKYCAQLQENSKTKNIPVIFLTGQLESADKVMGFSLGAEDYVTKPFDPHELKARINVRIKKALKVQARQDHLKFGELRFELARQQAFLRLAEGEKVLNLAPTAFKLLLHMAKHEGQVFSRDQLISATWGETTFIVDRTVDTHIGSLRKQLTSGPIKILSVHGIGYKLVRSASKAISAA